MSCLPNCPVCGEDSLRPEINDAGGALHYSVRCDACGIGLHHGDFYGFNNVTRFFKDVCAPSICENFASVADDMVSDKWECSACGAKRTKAQGEPPYRHCPDCGAQVKAW